MEIFGGGWCGDFKGVHLSAPPKADVVSNYIFEKEKSQRNF
jgi:hypothetical protein